jgi:tripartite-type tricarboxylate transporter receptor subunit TctC
MRMTIISVLSITTWLIATGTPAAAQTYPSKPVKVIVPIAAGSGIDVVARAVSQRLQDELGQPFVVENRAGAGTTTGAAAVASAAPDGYTILFHSVALTITPVTMAKLPYDVARDFAGIMPIVNTPLILVSPPGKFKTLADLVATAKELNGGMNYASIGYGAAAHFTSERLALAAGFKAQMVPFRGTSEAMTEVLAGRMDFYFTPATTAQGLIAEGKLDALATTSRKRLADMPNVPTTLEAGYKDSDFDFWVGMLVPAKTPREIVDTLHARTLKISRSPEFQKQMAAVGGEVMEPLTPAEFDAFLKKEIDRNHAIAKAAGITAK